MNKNLSGAQFGEQDNGNQPPSDESLNDGGLGDQNYRMNVAASMGVPSGFARSNSVELPSQPNDNVNGQQFSPENTSGPDPTRAPRSAPGRSGWNGEGRKFIPAGGDPGGSTTETE